MANILASGISNKPHLVAFDEMAEARLAALDLSVLLIYLIDIVNVDALPILAEQFDILGFKGYGLASTEADKRAVIKKAIELHRYKGTPWSIREALKTLGYPTTTIQERIAAVPVPLDGSWEYDGSRFYGVPSSAWATFRVIVSAVQTGVITQQIASDIRALMLEYKNARSALIGLAFGVDTTETLAMSLNDNISAVVPQTEALAFWPAINGLTSLNGTYQYDNDTLNIQVI